MFAISDNELENCLPIGNTILCNICGEMHNVEYGDKVNKDGSKEKSSLLAFIKCPTNNKCYLVGIGGKMI